MNLRALRRVVSGPLRWCSICSFAVVLMSAAPADAWYTGSEYAGGESSGQCSPSRWSDPLTVFFFGSAASVAYLSEEGGHKSAFEFNLGWTHHQEAGTDYLNEGGGTCTTADDQVASAYGYQANRFHVRLWQPYADMNYAYTSYSGSGMYFGTVGTPHHENWDSTCHASSAEPWSSVGAPFGYDGSHVVDWGAKDRPGWYNKNGSGFDRARRRVAYGFENGHHEIYYIDWKNTRSFKQCNGDYAGSNGKVAYITSGRY